MVNIKFKYKIKEVARKYNLPESVVEEIFNSQFKFYRETVAAIPLNDINTVEEFNELKHIFYFKFIGKFFINWRRVEKIKQSAAKGKTKRDEED